MPPPPGVRTTSGVEYWPPLTYRWHGHMEGETVQYRSDDEIADWKERDPITRFERHLVDEGVLTENHVRDLAKEMQKEVERAVTNARSAADPKTDSFADDVFTHDDKVLFEPPRPDGDLSDSTPVGSSTVTVSRAIYEALAEEMERDERVFLLGEDVTTGGYFAVTDDLAERFPDRVLDTPISEYAIVGAAVGAAMTGMRPVAEILFSDFLTCCMDPIVNQAAKLRYMSVFIKRRELAVEVVLHDDNQWKVPYRCQVETLVEHPLVCGAVAAEGDSDTVGVGLSCRKGSA